MTRRLRVQLLDDVPLVHHGLGEMFEGRSDVEFVDPAHTNADIALHDPFLPRDAATARRIAHRLHLRPPWVVWTWDRHRWVDPHHFPALPAGYLHKSSGVEVLVEDLGRIDGGQYVVNRDGISRAGERWLGQYDGLTRRESDVLVGVVDGLTNLQIASRHSLSPNTVKTYIRGAYAAIGARTRAHAVVWCVEHGLRPPLATEDDAVED